MVSSDLDPLKNSTPDTEKLIRIIISLGERFAIPTKTDDNGVSEVEPLAHFEADYMGIYKITDEKNGIFISCFSKFIRSHISHIYSHTHKLGQKESLINHNTIYQMYIKEF